MPNLNNISKAGKDLAKHLFNNPEFRRNISTATKGLEQHTIKHEPLATEFNFKESPSLTPKGEEYINSRKGYKEK